MNYLFERIDGNDSSHAAAIEQISDWSKKFTSMKSYGAIEIAEHPLGILAFNEGGDELLGHVAITEINEIDQQRYARIGAFLVSTAYRGNGLGGSLVGHLIKIAPDTLPAIQGFYAFVHDGSIKPFLENGADIIGWRDPSHPHGSNIIVSIKA